MADKQRDGKEPLNEREREILEELERQMGGEVGITPSDPEEARRRENDKARVDLTLALFITTYTFSLLCW